jgi:uncharacterized membrane protein YhaH (DUF805 family)
MNFTQAIASGFRHYVAFAGRASRSEYWYWILFMVIGTIVAGILDQAVFSDIERTPFSAIFILITFLPSLAIGVRRLHDIGRTGWWLLISFIIIIGTIVLIVWFCQKGDAGPNQYGPDPWAGSP